MSDNNDFFPSLKGDKGLTAKINKKSQITITFIGDNGPLTVALSKDNSQLFIDHLQEIRKLTTPPEVTKEIEPKNPANFIQETLRNLNQPWHCGNDMSAPHIQELDPNDHPFVKGHSNEPNQKLTGED